LNRFILFLLLLPCLGHATQILVSFSILKDMTQNLVPQGVEIVSILGPDQDPHGYSLSARDYLTLKKADVILYVGQGFDSWIESASQKVGSHADMYYVTKDISLLKADAISSSAGFDPHFWQSPSKTIEVIQKLSVHLEKVFPQMKSDIEKRTQKYLNLLDSLQKKYQQAFSILPESKRKLIVTHNSFQYAAHDFSLQIDSLLDASLGGESSLQRVSELVKKVRTEKIKSLFLEKSAPETLMKTLSQETSTPIAGTLYSDALSFDSKADTYLKLLQYNFDLILNSMKDF
jgi:zinc/manganese transport system substrate-binding protein